MYFVEFSILKTHSFLFLVDMLLDSQNYKITRTVVLGYDSTTSKGLMFSYPDCTGHKCLSLDCRSL